MQIQFQTHLAGVARNKDDSGQYDSHAVGSVLVTENNIACATNGRIMAIAGCYTGGVQEPFLLPASLVPTNKQVIGRTLEFETKDKEGQRVVSRYQSKLGMKNGRAKREVKYLAEAPAETKEFPRIDLMAPEEMGDAIEVTVDALELVRLARGLSDLTDNRKFNVKLCISKEKGKPIIVLPTSGSGFGIINYRGGANALRQYYEMRSQCVPIVTKALKKLLGSSEPEKASAAMELAPRVAQKWRHGRRASGLLTDNPFARTGIVPGAVPSTGGHDWIAERRADVERILRDQGANGSADRVVGSHARADYGTLISQLMTRTVSLAEINAQITAAEMAAAIVNIPQPVEIEWNEPDYNEADAIEETAALMAAPAEDDNDEEDE